MALKGTTRIELTNVKTGEVEVIEKTNMVTNAVNDVLSMNPAGILFRNYAASKNLGELSSMFDTFFPICPNLIGGIMLFGDALEEDPEKYFADQSNPVIGYSSNDVNPGTDMKRGSLNQTESGALDDGSGYRFVFDFETSQANGTIASVGLTSPQAGVAGHGSRNIAEDEYRKPVMCVYSYTASFNGAYINNSRPKAMANIVSIDPENNIGYFAYVTGEKMIAVGKMRMDLSSIGLRRCFPENTVIIESTVVETEKFASVLYTNHWFFGTLIDGGDGYIWGFQHEGNAPGNSDGNASILWVKISKTDWTVEEGTWTVAAPLCEFGKTGDFSATNYDSIENNSVIKDGKLYVLNYSKDYHGTIYEIPLNNPTAVKAYSSYYTWSNSNNDGSICRLNVVNGRVRSRFQYVDGEQLSDGYVRMGQYGFNSMPSATMVTNRCAKPGLVWGPYIFSIGVDPYTLATNPSYTYHVNIYLQMCFLATINNLPTPVQKTADKTMKITYILREES